MKWVNNTDGKPDAVLTLTLVAFVFVMLKFTLSGVSLSIGEAEYTLGTIAADEIAAVLTPTLGAYVARRYTDKKLPPTEVVVKDEINPAMSVTTKRREG